MQWIRASSYRIKSVNGENFIVPIRKKIKKSSIEEVKKDLIWKGCQLYNVDEYRQEAVLDFLNVREEKGALEFTKKFGPLGLYWYFTGAGFENVPLRVFEGPLEQVYWTNSGKSHEVLQKLGIEKPLMNEGGSYWLDYREPLKAVIDESKRFLLYYAMLKKNNKPKMTLPAKIEFMGEKPYWVPDTTTLIEYLYAWLPVLMANGLNLRLCENENCRKYFIGRKKHCTEACKNAQNQREKRQRETIMRRLGKGMSLEEAAAGYDMEKVKAWLEEGLIFLPMKSNYSKGES